MLPDGVHLGKIGSTSAYYSRNSPFGEVMAQIRVRKREAYGEDFPTICMRCGARTERLIEHAFEWRPPWVAQLGALSPLIWSIASELYRKTFRVSVPLCDRHANHWMIRKLFLWLGLFCCLCFGIMVAIVAGLLDPGDGSGGGIIVIIGIAIYIIGTAAWAIGVVILFKNAIKAADMSEKWIDIDNVNQKFAKKWKQIREELDHEREERE
jgi:hypothetical protein